MAFPPRLPAPSHILGVWRRRRRAGVCGLCWICRRGLQFLQCGTVSSEVSLARKWQSRDSRHLTRDANRLIPILHSPPYIWRSTHRPLTPKLKGRCSTLSHLSAAGAASHLHARLESAVFGLCSLRPSWQPQPTRARPPPLQTSLLCHSLSPKRSGLTTSITISANDYRKHWHWSRW